VDRCEADLAVLEKLADVHAAAKNRYQVNRVKQLFEGDRLTDSVNMLHRQLLAALNARARALEKPTSALNEIAFEECCKESDESLRCLRFEILDVRERLVQEGANLRALMREEYNNTKNEQTRSKMMREYVVQMASLDAIIVRNRYDANNLYESLEDLVVFEADKEDDGTTEHTVDSEGYRYVRTRNWRSPEVDRCKNTIALVEAKIAQAEGVAVTAFNNATFFLESMSSQWRSTAGDAGDGAPEVPPLDGAEVNPSPSTLPPPRPSLPPVFLASWLTVNPTTTTTTTTVLPTHHGVAQEERPDSWLAKSDYLRAQRLQADVVRWVEGQLHKLSNRERLVQAEVADLRLQAAAVEDHLDAGLRAQVHAHPPTSPPPMPRSWSPASDPSRVHPCPMSHVPCPRCGRRWRRPTSPTAPPTWWT
jgi:hypothetical protein